MEVGVYGRLSITISVLNAGVYYNITETHAVGSDGNVPFSRSF